MNPSQNQNQFEQQPPSQPPEPTVVQPPVPSTEPVPAVTPKPRKRLFSKFFIYVMVFLLGAIAYATSVAVYKLSQGENPIDDFTTSIDESADSVKIVSSYEDRSISEEDLSQYVTPVDCTTKSEFEDLKINHELVEVETISLYDGIRINDHGGNMWITWEELPEVVDHECTVIKITEIEKGDRITAYIDKAAYGANVDEPTRLLQKATK